MVCYEMDETRRDGRDVIDMRQTRMRDSTNANITEISMQQMNDMIMYTSHVHIDTKRVKSFHQTKKGKDTLQMDHRQGKQREQILKDAERKRKEKVRNIKERVHVWMEGSCASHVM